MSRFTHRIALNSKKSDAGTSARWWEVERSYNKKTPLELLWNCSEIALELHWNCSEWFIQKNFNSIFWLKKILHWNCSGNALELLWKCCNVAAMWLQSGFIFHLDMAWRSTFNWMGTVAKWPFGWNGQRCNWSVLDGGCWGNKRRTRGCNNKWRNGNAGWKISGPGSAGSTWQFPYWIHQHLYGSSRIFKDLHGISRISGIYPVALRHSGFFRDSFKDSFKHPLVHFNFDSFRNHCNNQFQFEWIDWILWQFNWIDFTLAKVANPLIRKSVLML